MSKILAVNAVYHSFKDDKIIAWQTIENDDGKIKREKIEEKIVHDYYILNDKSESDITDIYGNKVEYKIADNKYSLKDLKKTGVKLCEEDLEPAIKWMHKKYEGIEFKTKPEYFNIAYVDIELESGDSFTRDDIDNTVYPINLISMKMSKDLSMRTWGKFPYEEKDNYHCIEDEKELLTAFFTFFRKAKIDIITGWNSKFDVDYLINRAKLLGVEVSISPIGEEYQNRKTKEWSIGGISHLDYMKIYKDQKYHPEKLAAYSLQSVAMLELGEGKMQYDGQINDLWKRDWKLYVDYNIQDVDLVFKLEEKKKYISLIISICHNSLIPFEKGFSAIALAEGQMLSFMHRDNMVMPNRNEYKWADDEERPGGYVEATDGFYEEDISYDYESLYPKVILHGNVSPETLMMHPSNKEGLIRTVISDSDGVYYRKDKKGIIPRIIELNFKERKEFKELKKKYEREGNVELAEYYDLQQLIRKLLLNSIYGIMSVKYFHFYNENMSKTITMGGQHLIQHMRDATNSYFSDYFYKNPKYFDVVDEKNRIKNKVVILVDTDSIFLNVKPIKALIAPNDDLITWVNKFNDEFFSPFFKRINDQYFLKNYGVESEMNFKLEKIISQMIIFGKKNYAVLTLSNEGVVYKEPKMSVTGFASKRSDRPYFCRKKINETLDLFFATHDKYKILDFIRQVKKDFVNQPIEDISRPSGITDYDKYAKSFEDYDKNGLKYALHTPIHNRAAIVYNYIVEKMKLPNNMVYSGSKLKYIYVYPNNSYRSDVIGYMGNYPEKFKEIFKINYEMQFDKTYLEAIQTLFAAVNWGNINLSTSNDTDWIS